MPVAISVNKNTVISRIDKRLYGSFIEHLGRAVYSGIYEPEHSSADEQGFRQDVAELVAQLNVPIVRYPGGNFVSAYNWLDGVGAQQSRLVRLDLAWHSSESNQVGLHEFADWSEKVGCEMMLAVNLGSKGLNEARELLEYANHPQGTYWSDLRIKNGRQKPFNVRVWCLGNEMDGPWQIGHKTAYEYGRLALETAQAMRAYDRKLQLVVCGSSSPQMATFPQWERQVLELTYEEVDFISLHMYFSNAAGNTANYLAQPLRLEQYIDTVSDIIAEVKQQKQSSRQVYISFDEWNVWYHSQQRDQQILQGESGWPFAPPLLEDEYNAEDALLVACLINSFIRKSDVVKIACLAQLVNVIAPIMTQKGGAAWRQSIFYPFCYASNFGRGLALAMDIAGPTYSCECGQCVPYIDGSAVYDDNGHLLSLFLVNRHPDQVLDVDISLTAFGPLQPQQHKVLLCADLTRSNNCQQPNAVAPVDGDNVSVVDNRLMLAMQPYSYHFIQLLETQLQDVQL